MHFQIDMSVPLLLSVAGVRFGPAGWGSGGGEIHMDFGQAGVSTSVSEAAKSGSHTSMRDRVRVNS